MKKSFFVGNTFLCCGYELMMTTDLIHTRTLIACFFVCPEISLKNAEKFEVVRQIEGMLNTVVTVILFSSS